MTTTAAAPPEPARATRARFPSGTAAVAVALSLAVTALVVVAHAFENSIPFPVMANDFAAFRIGGAAVLDGASPFEVATGDGYQFLYPPFAALTLAPLGLVSVEVGFALWTFATMVALIASVWLALGLLAPASTTRRARFAVLAAAVAIPTTPVLYLLGFGQVNVFLMLLCLLDLARRPGRFQGVAIGIAAGIKLTPLIFVAYFLLTRRTRAAVVTAVTFAATAVVGFLALPGASVSFWTEHVLDTDRMVPPGAAPFIQSMRGVLAQLPGFLSAQWVWLLLALVVGASGLLVSAWASRRGLEAAGALACAVTGLLISPISWPQHWVWVVPALAAWLWWARERRGAGHAAGVLASWLVLVATAALMFPTPIGMGVVIPPVAGIVFLGSLQVLGGLAFLGALAAALRRRDRAPEPVPGVLAPSA
ncbi:glycosyltransferase 87 family protein [Saccharothrix sp. Mg75]|uniref:glycosyltransferase 87 family protein n=1 Tax=Saccharothrix sp. Mg75 TaxID=3445357 RepID=UPI003EEF89D3